MSSTAMALDSEQEFQEILRKTFLEEAQFLLDDCESALMELEHSTDREASLGKIFRVAHSIKGSAAAVGFHDLASLGHVAEDCLAVLRVYPGLVDGNNIGVLLAAVDLLKNRVLRIAEDTSVSAAPWPEGVDAKRRIADLTRSLEHGGNVKLEQGADTAPPPSDAADDGSEALPVITSPSPTPAGHPRDDHAGARAKPATLLKIDSERVEQVLNLVGELVVLKSQLTQLDAVRLATDQEANEVFTLFDRTIRDLYDKTLSMRMTSLKSLFMKMQRSMRDLSVKLGKSVDFQTQGEDTELDRGLIELMADPILHLCRNALDHGLETPEERKRKGKTPTGCITLKAFQRGASVVLEINDDGPGVDRERVLAKAVERGLVPSLEAGRALPDAQVFEFLFRAGFSTAKVVTDVSGRGVGLDVVRSNIEMVKGKVEIESQSGNGTKFRLILPLTTAITDGIVLQVGEDRYVMPIETIREFVQPDQNTITIVDGHREVANVRGDYLPLLRLGEVFSSKHSTEGVLAVVESMERRFTLMVDKVLGQTQVVLKNLDKEFSKNPHVAGGAILGDGRVGLVLDMATLATTVGKLTQGAREQAKV